ncbi:MAG: TonB-dependent receptor [Dysgonamonadaceae bacterium]|jgi:TonB-linked SusC/RagA family outer membrane protein|nr:TonB-dependent receptor [Dysgonamonadaceae bacterium]
MKFKICLYLLLLGSASLYANPSQSPGPITVKGIVTDKTGETLIGVSVSVKETPNIGTVTDLDGRYSLSQAPANGTLVFSYVGMTTREVNIAGREEINLVMDEQSIGLDQVVVTAFATQKRINVTGAISTVSGKDLVSTPVANISNALIGNTPGVSGLQVSGEPGQNAATLRIRGVATYGDNTPLIVIDGIEQSAEQAFAELNSMDPNEILGVSILKDASSTAVYGIRAANGVIIVTTKRGIAGKPVISFSSNFGMTQATKLQHNLSSYDWASMRNEAIDLEMRSYTNAASNALFKYNDDDLWKFQNNRDFTPAEVESMNLTPEQKAALLNSPALYYGSHDLYSEQFGKYGPQAQFNVNISGGTDRVKYFASIGYFTQEGITNAVKYYGSNTQSSYERYNFRSNFDIQALSNLKISVGLAGQFGSAQGPGTSNDPYDLGGRYKQIMQYIYDGNPLQAPGIIDNHLINSFAGVAGSVQNPLATKTNSQIGSQNAVYNLLTSGTGIVDNTLLNTTIKIEHELDYLLKNLTLRGTVNYQDNYNRVTRINPSLPAYSVQRNIDNPNILEFFGGSIGEDSFSQWGYSNWNKLYLDGGLDWSGSFDRHHISALLLGKASKYYMPGDSNNTNTPSGVIGLVGRVTYNFDERYMAEVNLGYNGTEQFQKGKRFGLFPAYSIGWVPSSEAFFPKNTIWTFAKIRTSYGEVGNDRLGGNRRYLYLPNTYNLNQSGYWWGNTGNTISDYYAGVAEGTLGNPNVTWEKAKKTDVGVELKFLSDRIHLTYDYFTEKRNDILTTLGIIPGIYGVSSSKVPPANVGKTSNKGYEVVLGWTDHIQKFGYYIEGNWSYSKNKIIYQAEAPNPYYWMNRTGFSIGQRFGLKSDGLFNTQEELANRPYNNYTSNKATLGDIRYMDLNGDGIINNEDVAPIGYPNFPEYHYGVKLGFDYKGFDIRFLFSGTMHGSYYVGSGISMPYYKYAGNAWQWQFDGRWTPEKYAAGEAITYPRALFNGSTSDNNFLGVSSDYWILSNDHFKLKNIEIGYSFPSGTRFMRNAHIAGLRLYANGNNIFTFRNALSELGIDPETADSSGSYIYPLTRIVNVGFNIQF